MKKASLNLCTILFLLSVVFQMILILSVDATPEERTVGVNVGDSFLYDISYSLESNDPSPQLVWPNEYASLMLEVDNITNTIVNIGWHAIEWDSLFDFKTEGSQTVEGNHLNVETGEFSSGAFMWPYACISTNLSAGDLIYTSSVYRINETVTRTYPDEERQTNHLNLYLQEMNGTMDAYWDKATGVLVEFSWLQFNESGGYTTEESLFYQLVDTNLWVVPEFPSFLVLPLFMIITLLAVMVYRRKHSM